MVRASTRSIDTGKSRLSCGMRVAVTTTEVNSPALSPYAASDAPSSQPRRATWPKDFSAHIFIGNLPRTSRYVRRHRRGQSLKSRDCMPLLKDLSRSSHNPGLNTARLALIVAASVAAAGAKDVHSEFAVSATVRAVADIELQSAPSNLLISDKDIRRGYIDIVQPTQFTVRSNSANGFALEVMTVAPVLSSMTIAGLNSDLF